MVKYTKKITYHVVVNDMVKYFKRVLKQIIYHTTIATHNLHVIFLKSLTGLL